MSEVPEKIIERIQKMLRLANDAGASEGERNNALRMAHATLAKYNLDLASVESYEQRKRGRGIAGRQFPNHVWARQVCNAVGRLFFSFYICTRGGNEDKGSHFFVGKEVNAVTASLVAEFAVRSIVKEGTRRMREGGHKWSFFRAFGAGAAVRIAERVEALMRDRNQVQGSESKALVLASLYSREAEANKHWLEEVGLQTEASPQPLHFEARASAEGYAYGDTVPLNTQVEKQA